MDNSRLILFVFVLALECACLTQSAVSSEPSGEAWTLADFEALALQRNPSLGAAWARVEAARGQRIQSGLYPNTVVGYQSTEMGIRDTAGQQGAFVSQRFITGGKRQLDVDIASQEVLQAEAQFTAQQSRVLNDVRTRFYDVLIAQRRVELSGGLVRVGEQSVEASEKLLEGRQVGRNDVLQAEIEAESARILDGNARNEHAEAWRRLAAVVGVPLLRRTHVVGNLEADLAELNWEDSISRILAQSPELDAAAARIERAHLAVHRAYRERIPNVDLMVAVRHHNFTMDDVANVQVGIPIPYLDRNQGNIYRAKAEYSAAQAEVLQIQLDLQDRLAVTFRRYENARQQTDKYSHRILPRAKESLQLVQQAYREGQVGYLTLLTSQRTYFEVSLAYLQSLRELREAAIVIQGQLLTGSLQRR